MELFVGLDVSVRTTRVCVMDTSGKLIKEGEVETEPDAIWAFRNAVMPRYGGRWSKPPGSCCETRSGARR
ncbi:hypothetical protein HGP14_34585 [Rhizobium sp. P32RR-XVIII]|uniref:hypothetical protein n=1 Tax=Rhizobium sp. P32RR-XVIII TaxID=2726738 RepID=UPI001456795D|nr:hypothetical protein [Rhizobium sp. P32RR-XVIII]NLS08313.1 hypothetical protein [Rhizobium sp. P32RR-XVIII]